MDNREYLSVSEINSYIKTYLENNYFLRDIYIKGEISNFKKHQSGTFYFSIKDATSQISVVMFSSYASKITTPLKDGALVLIKGRLTVYEARGSYQIQAYDIVYDSIGLLYQEYEKLKKKLEMEGLFNIEHKKPLPPYPNTIGIITAPYGAAIHDMINTINHRWPLAQIILFPSLVQGTKAAENIVQQIQVADYYGVDVIICGRGGGSIEDLWPFNEEIVARAIYECKTPIISAVGHQNDFTIADFVADKRGLTPTDGATQATPKIEVELEKVKKIKEKLAQLIKNILSFKQQQLLRQKKAYVFEHPEKLYEVYRIKLDSYEDKLKELLKQQLVTDSKKINDLSENMIHIFKFYLQNKKTNFVTNIVKLDALSPLKVLKRGYGVVLKDNKAIRSISQIAINDEIDIVVSDGKIKTKVASMEEK